MTNDLISRAELRRSLMIWADKLRTLMGDDFRQEFPWEVQHEKA